MVDIELACGEVQRGTSDTGNGRGHNLTSKIAGGDSAQLTTQKQVTSTRSNGTRRVYFVRNPLLVLSEDL